jgi:replicative DNA helicase
MTAQKFNTHMQAAPLQSATSTLAKLPPQALAIERAVLCAAMLDSDATNTVLESLTEQAFYSREHRHIFAAIRDVAADSQAVDLLTVMHQLKARGVLERVGGMTYLDKVLSTQSPRGLLPQHCKVVRQVYMRRVVLEVAATLQAKSYDEMLDPLELVGEASQQIGNLFTSFDKNAGGTVSDYLGPTFEHLRHVVRNPGLTGVPTGLLKLNDATGGWQGGDLIVLAGRPGMGKTAAMLKFALAACFDEQKHGVIFSLEMPVRQLMHRLISHESGVPYSKIRRGELPGGVTQVEQLLGQCTRLASGGHRLHIEDGSSLSMEQLRAKCHRLHQQHPLGLVMVDYIQLMEAVKRSGNREQEIASISRGLKKLAKELDVPVIALSQLSREVEKARDKRPELQHLRESGAIEQDADAVAMLWRPEYYKITELEDGTSTAGLMLIDFKKNRNGNLGEVFVGCDIKVNRLFDLEEAGVFEELPAAAQDYQPTGIRLGTTGDFGARPLTKREDLPF